MAEIKNSFLKSKMNKDLDDRLIPNGEYRDAQNISVGKSEDDDIGALETVLGNSLSTDFDLAINSLEIIGYKSIDNLNDNGSIIVFLTNYNDINIATPRLAPSAVTTTGVNDGALTNSIDLLLTAPNTLIKPGMIITGTGVQADVIVDSVTDSSNFVLQAPITIANTVTLTFTEPKFYIYMFSPGNTPTKLVEGTFLNFSKTNPISGISIIEDLLFWTDNRNQPRKINIGLADNGAYYTRESDISVAKYNPYQPIGLLQKVTTETTTAVSSATLAIADTTGIYKGMLAVQYGNTDFGAEDYFYVDTVNTNVSVVLNAAPTTVNAEDVTFLATTMTGEDITFNFNNGSPDDWPGDPDYLESRFVRLSYRFEFDDGEYSIMAPFTQIAYIPKQKGYFINGDEDSTYRSTVVEFMENGVQNIKLLIPFPDTLNNVEPSSSATYKIKALDILYKESDARAVKVLDTVNWDDRDEDGNTWVNISTTNIYTYNYQSRKPFRVLPENQTVRVYDKVPVKALAQETAGNRIIYGNFLDKYNAPSLLNYIVGVGPKSLLLNFDNWCEYPNHSVKQNRNYQVGFVLADKFGRQSDVILSSIKISNTTADDIIYGGDTIFSPYNVIAEATSNPVHGWFGDALKVDLQGTINSLISTTNGTPGLYAVITGNGYNTYQAVDQPSIVGNTYEFKLDAATGPTEIPIIGSYLQGEFTDYVYISNVQSNTPTADWYRVTTIGQVSSIYLQQSPTTPDNKYAYDINPTGWYSYKIVVKQQEQDYYNVYLPGILSDYPDQTGTPPPFPSDPTGATANIVLINDNINKIPRDLAIVGPDQKQFRSSVQLSGRVSNNSGTTNIQYYPGILTDTAISISTAEDSNMDWATLGTTGKLNLYQIDTNPLIARLATNENNIIGDVTATMRPFLAIYETEPQDSLLDIFWETPTVGLISEINDAILSDYEGATGWESYNSILFTESSTGVFITGLSPVNQSGNNLFNTGNAANTGPPSFTVVDNSVPQQIVTGDFTVTRTGVLGTLVDPFLYDIGKNTNNFVFNSNTKPRTYTLTMAITNHAVSPAITSQALDINLSLQNTSPIINGGVALPSISNNTGTSGVIVTLTGVNGAAKTSSNQEELIWSIEAGNTAGYFSIDSSTGAITQSPASVAAYNLTIRLTDANGAIGTLFDEEIQQVIVSSTAIGFAFYAGDTQGNVSQVCPVDSSQDPTCGNNTYWNAGIGGGGGGTATPVVNDIISTTEFVITFLTGGFYSYNCGSGAGRTGTDRRIFQVEYGTGRVTSVTTC